MKVRASGEVAEFIAAHGGRLYVWTEPHRFFMSAFTILRTAAKPPNRLRSGVVPEFRSIRCDSFEVLIAHGSRPPPTS